MKRTIRLLWALALCAAPVAGQAADTGESRAAETETTESGEVGGLFGLFRKAAPEDGAPAAPGGAEEAPVEGASAPSPEEPVSPAVAAEDAPGGAEEAPVEGASAPSPEEPLPAEGRDTVEKSSVPPSTRSLDEDLRASRRAPDGADVVLPTEEIRGELERPDIFFLLPKARSKTDEQLIRARIRREITRPLIKDWLEEELLLK